MMGEDWRDGLSAEQLRVLGDPFRLRLFELVRERDASITELAAIVERPKSTVSYHVRVLVDAGLARVARTLRVRGVEQRIYGRMTC
jgi:DNA-binding transcriptional ArsR family regulator